jgi:hypothetical protein
MLYKGFMARYFCLILTFSFFSFSGFTQVDQSRGDFGFEVGDSIKDLMPLTREDVQEYLESYVRKGDEKIIGGQVVSIFHEVVDDALITVKIEGQLTDSITAVNGLFVVPVSDINKEKLLDFHIEHSDYHSFDTSLIFTGEETLLLTFQMIPKHKILLRGRVYAGNIPIEGADVEIHHGNDVHNLITRGCFYDDEDYWNCLFDGMFKQELIAEDLSDSIHLLVRSEGMETLTKSFSFSEYTGEVMQIKMKYASRLPEMPSNNLNLKLALPFATSDHDWFVDLSYYRVLNKTNLKRIAWGIDGNMYVSTISVSYPTLSGLEPAESDSSYITGFLGPSLLFWVLSPDKRRFSTYVGCTFSYEFSKPQFVIQPFAGTRYFLDINKALSLEFRYFEYDRDVIHYVFNAYGNASRYKLSKHFVKFHINLGIQIVF